MSRPALVSGCYAPWVADFLTAHDLAMIACCSHAARLQYRPLIVQRYVGVWPQPKLLEFPNNVRSLCLDGYQPGQVVDLSCFPRLRTANLNLVADALLLPDSLRTLELYCKDAPFPHATLPRGLKELSVWHVEYWTPPPHLGDFFREVEKATELEKLNITVWQPADAFRWPPNVASLHLCVSGDTDRLAPLPQSLRHLSLRAPALPRNMPSGLVTVNFTQTPRGVLLPGGMDFGEGLLRELFLSDVTCDAATIRLPHGLKKLTLHDTRITGCLPYVPDSLKYLQYDGAELLPPGKPTAIEKLAVITHHRHAQLDMHLWAKCPRVARISLTYSSDDPLERYLHSLPLAALRRLKLFANVGVQQLDVDFERMPLLERLFYDGDPLLRGTGLASCAHLCHVDIHSCNSATPELLLSLPSAVRYLKVRGSTTTVSALENLPNLRNLQHLRIATFSCLLAAETGVLLRTAHLPLSLQQLEIVTNAKQKIRFLASGGRLCHELMLQRSQIRQTRAIHWTNQ